MIFTRNQAAAIRQGKVTAVLVPAGSKLRAGRLISLKRRVTVHDCDGRGVGERVESVEDTLADGRREPVMLTVHSVIEAPVTALTQADARACGYVTLAGVMKDYSHMRVVRLVRFVVGDVRDRDRYLNRTGRVGGDYTDDSSRSADRDIDGRAVAALSEQDLVMFAKAARGNDDERTAETMRTARKMPLEARLDNLEALRRERRTDMTREMRVIEERVGRAERLLDGPTPSGPSAV